MRYSDLRSFKDEIRGTAPGELVEGWLTDENPCAFSDAGDLKKFTDKIKADYPNASTIAIAGTSNWQFSLNPKKEFSEYNKNSDIDVALISPVDFEYTWNELRSQHRKSWYSWGPDQREKVMRTGQNVYCGFISPKHIPNRASGFRFEFLKRCNSYSTNLVGYRDVNLMFFKNNEDLIDYYIRGVRLARSKL